MTKIPVHLRLLAFEALGGIERYAEIVNEDRDYHYEGLEETLRAWASGKTKGHKAALEKAAPVLERLQYSLSDCLKFSAEAHLFGGKADGCSIVWPEFNARLDPSWYNDFHIVLTLDDTKYRIHCGNTDPELGVLMLAKCLAKRNQDEAADLISRAPALANHVRKNGPRLSREYSWQAHQASKHLQEAESSLEAINFLLKVSKSS